MAKREKHLRHKHISLLVDRMKVNTLNVEFWVRIPTAAFGSAF